MITRETFQEWAAWLLDEFGLDYTQRDLLDLSGNPDGAALVALLCNYAAKTVDYGFYGIKPALTEYAVSLSPAQRVYWDEDGRCLYLETSVGQVSFHYVGRDWEDQELLSAISKRTPIRWDGGHLQDRAPELVRQFLRD